MPTKDELANRRRRRAWWIAAVRRADPRRPKLEQVAEAVGLKATSASTISDWENNIGGGPSMEQLELLAAFYGVPLKVFTEPGATEQEWLDGLRDLAVDAVDLERQDSQTEQEADPNGEGGRPSPLRRRSA